MMNQLFVVAVALANLAAPALAEDLPSDADLTACLGGKKAWTPTVFAKLKEKMTPAEAAKVLPGADQVSKFGFVTVKAEGCNGAAEFELYFAKDKKTQEPTSLQAARIIFSPSVSTDETFYLRLVKVLEAKYGKVKKQSEIDNKLITWVNRKFKTAQLSRKPGKKDQLQLNVRI